MKAGEVLFRDLLGSPVQYRVPLFQRTYNWDEDQWAQLWHDLLEIYEMDKPRNHFIGSVVTQPIHGLAGTVPKYLLIDGQQRMTTLLILLSVIRHRARSLDMSSSLADEIQETYLINKFAKSSDEKLKLMPTRRDLTPFSLIVNGGTPSANTQIDKAWMFFDQSIRHGDIEGKQIDLENINNCVVIYLDVVSITLEDNDSPNRIFESLNNTGMPLGVSDLIRNYLFMNIQELDKQEYAYEEFWFPMQELLTSKLDDFFWQYLMMYGSTLRRDETFEEVRRLLDTKETSDQIIDALREFHKFSRYFAQVAELDVSGLAEGTADQLHRLNEWEVDVARSFVMKALDHVWSKSISEEDLAIVLKMIESFLVRRAVCGVPTNSLRRYFTQMSVGVDFTDFVKSSREHLLDRTWPSDNEFAESFVHFRLYVPARLKRTRLILHSLELSFGSKETPEFTSEITIEHIMPQTLSNEWRSQLGQSAAETHDQWLHTVGNLTLTGYNPVLGNMLFLDKKQKVFAEANFELSGSLKELDMWNAGTIEKRGRELAEQAVKIWPR